MKIKMICFDFLCHLVPCYWKCLRTKIGAWKRDLETQSLDCADTFALFISEQECWRKKRKINGRNPNFYILFAKRDQENEDYHNLCSGKYVVLTGKRIVPQGRNDPYAKYN